MDEKNKNLEKRKQELKKAIEITKQDKKNIINIVQNLVSRLNSRTIDRKEYDEELAKALGNRNSEQWIKYYDDYRDYYNQQIKLCDKLIKEKNFGNIKKGIQIILNFLIIFAVIGILISLFFVLNSIFFEISKKGIEKIGEKGIINEASSVFSKTKGRGELAQKPPAIMIPSSAIELSSEEINSFNSPVVTAENKINFNTNIKQGAAVVGEPVEWNFDVNLENPSSFNVELPAGSENVYVNEILDGEEQGATSEVNINHKKPFLFFGEEKTTINFPQNFKHYIIKYETSAPEIREEEIPLGKRIIVTGPDNFHYKNILTYSELPKEINPSEISTIKIYQVKNIDKNIIREPIVFSTIDLDEDGLLDSVEWITPFLNEAIFEIIIEISKAVHLDSNKNFINDIYEQVKAQDEVWSEHISSGYFVRVTFEKPLTNKNDITIYPRVVSENPKIEVYEINRNEIIASSSLQSEKYNKIYLTDLISESQDVFDLKIIDGVVELDHIIDPSGIGISTCSALQGIGGVTGTCAEVYYLVNDIDCTGVSFTSLCTGSYFSGIFDGNYHAIKNLYINSAGTTPAGLFSNLNTGANILNLVLENVTVFNLAGTTGTGGVAGNCDGDSLISGCYVQGVIRGNNLIGGLIGRGYGLTINNSYANVNISSSATSGTTTAGGLIGGLYSGNIINSYVVGNVTGRDRTGGMAGTVFNSKINNSYSIVKVSSPVSTNIGQFIGNIDTSFSVLNNNYAYNTVDDSAVNCIGSSGIPSYPGCIMDDYNYHYYDPVWVIYTANPPVWDFLYLWKSQLEFNDYPVFQWEKSTDVSDCQVLDKPNTDYKLSENIINPIMTNLASCINITSQNITFDCRGYAIISNYNLTGIYSNQYNTTIKNCNLSFGGGGNNSAVNIHFQDAEYSLIQNNTISGSGGWGIRLYSNNSELINNNVSTKGRGIDISNTKNNNLINNTGIGNTTSAGISVSDSNNIILVNNIGINYYNLGGSGIGLWNSDNITLINNTGIGDSGYGIYLYSSLNNTLIGNKGSAISSTGIYLRSSLTNLLTENNGTGFYGIQLDSYSDNNILLKNVARTNNLGSNAFGLVVSSSNNILTNNTGISIAGPGININTGKNNTLTINTGISTSGYGIYLTSLDNLLISNTGISNSANGIIIISSNNLLINNIGASNFAYGILLSSGSSKNILINQNATSYGNYGIFLSNSNNNIFQDCTYVKGTLGDISLTSNSFNNTFINCSYSTENIVAGSQLIRKWYYRAYVNDTKGLFIPNANVSAFNKTNGIEFLNLKTNSSGWTNITTITDYVNNGGNINFFSNYTINATNGSLSDEHTFNASLGNNLFDFFILGGILDNTAPNLTIISPLNNSNFNSIPIWFNASSNEVLSWCGASLNEGANITMNLDISKTNASITASPAQGNNYFVISCNDSAGNLGVSDKYYFLYDDIYPFVNVISPVDIGVYGSSVLFNVTSSETGTGMIASNLDNSLIGWWRMDDLNSSGGIIDYLGTNNGTNNGTVQVTNGKFGKAMRFDGSDDYTTITPINGNNKNEETISLWVKPNTIIGVQYFISLGFEPGGSGNYMAIGQSNSDIYFYLWNGAYIYSYANSVLTAGKWTHVTVRHSVSGSISEIYIDGVYKNNMNFYTDTSLNHNYIDIGRNSGFSNYFNGTIDEVMIFNRSLTASEILGLYNATKLQFYQNLNYGNHNYKAYVSDTAGNVNSSNLINSSVDTINPKINFLYPTPANNTLTANSLVIINASIIEENLNEIKYLWNGTNFTIYNDSLVLMMNFDNRSELGENATYLVDVSKFRNNGNVLGFGNLFSDSNGRYNRAFSFDKNNKITIPYSSSFDNREISVSAWVKLSNIVSTNSDTKIILKGNFEYGFTRDERNNQNKRIWAYINGWGNNLYIDLENYDTWNYITLTYGSFTNMNLYLNGILKSSKLFSGPISTLNSPIDIGDSFSGMIDEVRIWNRSLSSSEIYEQYISNLNKFNQTQWYLYVNQSKNATAGLDNGNYSYQACAKDNERENCTENRVITINGNNLPIVYYVQPVPDIDVKPEGLRIVYINFSVYDENGYNDINSSTARLNVSRENAVRQNLTCFMIPGSGNGNYANYSCNVSMRFFDSPGNWSINISIKDNSENPAVNDSAIFYYIPFIFGWRIVPDPAYINWSKVQLGALNQKSDNNLTIINQGNVNITKISVNASNLQGQTYFSDIIPAGNFRAGKDSCNGVDLILDQNVSIVFDVNYTESTEINPVYRELGFCLKNITNIEVQDYISTRNWEIDVIFTFASIALGRRKKKIKPFGKRLCLKNKHFEEKELSGIWKNSEIESLQSSLLRLVRKKIKEKFGIDIEELISEEDIANMQSSLKEKSSKLNIEVPVSIFKEEAGPAELLCTYLHENLNLKFSEISKFINRDQRTVWMNCHNSGKKKLTVDEQSIKIPINLFSDRRLSILESLVKYLREKEFKNKEIAGLLNQDPRVIGTLYSRVNKKLK